MRTRTGVRGKSGETICTKIASPLSPKHTRIQAVLKLRAWLAASHNVQTTPMCLTVATHCCTNIHLENICPHETSLGQLFSFSGCLQSSSETHAAIESNAVARSHATRTPTNSHEHQRTLTNTHAVLPLPPKRTITNRALPCSKKNHDGD